MNRKVLYGSLYDYFESEFNIYVQHASNTVSAYLPNARERQALEIDEKTPCLYMRMLDANQYDTPFMTAECIYRSDRYEISLRVQSDRSVNSEPKYLEERLG